MTQAAQRAEQVAVKRSQPLWWLGALLAVYLCAPFVASIPQIGQADWAGVDWHATWSAVGVSVVATSSSSQSPLAGAAAPSVPRAVSSHANSRV